MHWCRYFESTAAHKQYDKAVILYEKAGYLGNIFNLLFIFTIPEIFSLQKVDTLHTIFLNKDLLLFSAKALDLAFATNQHNALQASDIYLIHPSSFHLPLVISLLLYWSSFILFVSSFSSSS